MKALRKAWNLTHHKSKYLQLFAVGKFFSIPCRKYLSASAWSGVSGAFVGAPPLHVAFVGALPQPVVGTLPQPVVGTPPQPVVELVNGPDHGTYIGRPPQPVAALVDGPDHDTYVGTPPQPVAGFVNGPDRAREAPDRVPEDVPWHANFSSS